MKHWWCKPCFVPCKECEEDAPPENEDEIGKINSKTVDFRQQKKERQTDEDFESEVNKLGAADL